MKKKWMTSGLITSFIKKNKLYKSFLKNPNLNREIYIYYKNQLIHLIKTRKIQFFEEQININ